MAFRHVAGGQAGRAGSRQAALLRLCKTVAGHARDVQVLLRHLLDRPGLTLDLNSTRDYYLGGLDDMAAWTSLVWEQAAKALLGGTQVTSCSTLIDLNCPLIELPHPSQHLGIVVQWEGGDGMGFPDGEERDAQTTKLSRTASPTYPG